MGHILSRTATQALSCLLFGSDVLSRTFSHLSFEERKTISRMREQKFSQSEIARRLGRDRATISREIRRTIGTTVSSRCRWLLGDDRQRYGARPAAACRQALSARGSADRSDWKAGSRLVAGTDRRTVEDRTEGQGQHLSRDHLSLRLFTRGPTATARPAASGTAKKASANVATVFERTSRFTVLFKNNDRQSKPIMDRLINVLGPLPRRVRQSLTFDRGFEFVSWRRLKQGMGTDAWFCDPSAPWQKGSVENMNRRGRRYLPRDTAVLSVPEESIRSLIEQLNNTPRKWLGFRTPDEVFRREVLK